MAWSAFLVEESITTADPGVSPPRLKSGDLEMTTVFHDLRLAFRELLKTPALSALMVSILGLGIGANTAIFSIVYGVLLRPLPYEEGDRLVLVRQQMTAAGVDSIPFSVPEYFDYRDQSRAFDAMVEYHTMAFTMLGGEEPQRVQTGVVSWNFFDVLGTKPVLGRSFEPMDEKPGAEPILILSDGYWQRELAGDPAAIGRTFEMNDKIHTVVGVLPPVPEYPNRNDVYVPTSACPIRSRPDFMANRKNRAMEVFGRLKPGATLADAVTDVKTIASRLAAEYPEVYADGEGYDATAVALRDTLIGDSRATFLVLLGTVALVLLITCVNLANLAFARSLRREREMAVRTALGAARGRLVRQMLTESTLLAVLGGALGLVLAYAGIDFMIAFARRFTLRVDQIAVDVPVLAFALIVSIGTGLLFGLIPALSTSGNVESALREGGGRGTTSRAMKRLQNTIIVTQLAVAFVVLFLAGLMVRSFWKLQQIDAGFDSSKVLSVQMSLNRNSYSGREQRTVFFTSLLAKVEALPGVVSAALGRSLPLNEGRMLLNTDFEIEGELIPEGSPRPRTDMQVATAGIFETLGIPLLSGRIFADTEHSDSIDVVVISRSLARHYWGDRDPVGKRITFDRGKTWTTVVGMVGDLRHEGLDRDVTKVIYVPYFQVPQIQTNLLLRTAGDPMQLQRPVSRAVYSIDPEQPLGTVQTLDELRRLSVASPRLTTILLGLFAGLALVIAAAGLGGVIAFTVNQQSREFGVRMALGARRWSVLWAVFKGAAALVGMGLLTGAIGAFFAGKVMSSLLFGIAANDVRTFLGVGVLLALVTALASYLPARRATQVDPVEVLRWE